MNNLTLIPNNDTCVIAQWKIFHYKAIMATSCCLIEPSFFMCEIWNGEAVRCMQYDKFVFGLKKQNKKNILQQFGWSSKICIELKPLASFIFTSLIVPGIKVFFYSLYFRYCIAGSDRNLLLHTKTCTRTRIAARRGIFCYILDPML